MPTRNRHRLALFGDRDVLHAAAVSGAACLLSAGLARQLGIEAELCAAEARLRLTPRVLLRLAGEAGYVCLADLGARWARLIGHRRMLSRLG